VLPWRLALVAATAEVLSVGTQVAVLFQEHAAKVAVKDMAMYAWMASV